MTPSSEIRLIVCDVDGVWTDGKIIYFGDQLEGKEFHVRDGLAVKLAQRAGIPVALVTSRRSAAVERRARELGITDIHQGARSKLDETERLAQQHGIALEQVLYIGDDLPDLGAMMRAGISAAPSDAAAEVRSAAKWQLETAGGQGAIRELVERLLRERGVWDQIIQDYISGRPEGQSI